MTVKKIKGLRWVLVQREPEDGSPLWMSWFDPKDVSIRVEMIVEEKKDYSYDGADIHLKARCSFFQVQFQKPKDKIPGEDKIETMMRDLVAEVRFRMNVLEDWLTSGGVEREADLATEEEMTVS